MYHRFGQSLSPRRIKFTPLEIVMKRNLFSSFVLLAIMGAALCLSVDAQSRGESDVFDLVNRELGSSELLGPRDDAAIRGAEVIDDDREVPRGM